MNDADSTPSPSRFWIRFGMRTEALNTSAVAPTPRNAEMATSRMSPNVLDRKMPAATRNDPLRLIAAGFGIPGSVEGPSPSRGKSVTSPAGGGSRHMAHSGGAARERHLLDDLEAVASVEGDVRLLRGLEVGADPLGVAAAEHRVRGAPMPTPWPWRCGRVPSTAR